MSLLFVLMHATELTLFGCSLVQGGKNWVQVFGILRLCRLLRLVRSVPGVDGLMAVMNGIGHALSRLGYVFVLQSVILYVLSVVFVQFSVWNLDSADAGDLKDDVGIQLYFGSIWRCPVWLFAAMTGGFDWMDALQALWKLSLFQAAAGTALLLSFVFFASIVFLNLAAGVFIESVLSTLAADRELELRDNVTALLGNFEDDSISYEEFQRHLSDPEALRMFRALDIDCAEAERLFELLDYDASGVVRLNEFVSGCVRLHGPAKAIDLAALMYQHQRFRHEFEEHKLLIERCSLHRS